MKITNPWPFLILYLAFFPFSSKLSIAAQDTFTSSTSLSANDTLTSAGSTFVLGFFTRGNSTYLGIWYKKVSLQTVVWVANRDTPLSKSTGIVRIDGGNLILVEGLIKVVWSTNVSKVVARPIAQLLDSGNFVLRAEGDNNSDSFLWQSFDYPSDTLLPGMKLGWDLKAGLNRFLTSWKNDDDPSSGDYNYKMDQNGLAQLLLRFQSQLKYRTGPWNGVRFSGVPEMKPNSVYGFYCVSTPDKVYYTYEVLDSSLISRLVLNRTGHIERYTWDEESGGSNWKLYWSAPKDQCDEYSKCGPYGICNVNSSSDCHCVKGFEPKIPKEWSLGVTSAGCVRKGQLKCSGDGFFKLAEMKLPNSLQAFVNSSMSLEECRIECLNNCSCVAYASAAIAGGSGCIRWANDLTDLREYSDGGQDLYIRVPASELDQTRSITLDWRKRFNIIVGIARGILYLHEDSRLRIIHRDLKASNILLDDDMNPKISDFGMARIFGGNQTQANTNRVVGTYGYMSPEYAMDGLFSIKSDVFSFGVILLEIISGRRNNYYSDYHSMNLIGHVWELWKDDRILELIDSSMSISTSKSEVLRCIQVGLLCVQEKAIDRPNMSSVIYMLSDERTMPSPKQPAFSFWKGNCSDHPQSSTYWIDVCSRNEITITE